jgi:tRNA(His) 5'-end guanylyltransferase
LVNSCFPNSRLKLTELDQKYEQNEYPQIFDSAAVVLLQDTFPLYWHSEQSEYTLG